MDLSNLFPNNGTFFVENGVEYFLNSLIIVGALILILSLVPSHRLIAQIPPGKIRSNWQVLRVLIIIFIFGYLSYLAVNLKSGSGHAADTSYFVVPVVYFLGACFVYLVATFALETAAHIRRSTVLDLENITDPLLGIHNRRYLDHRLRQEVLRAVRYKLPLSILLVDIDHFRQVNDTYGRLVGDYVLTGLSKLALNTARNTDVVARYGGEEIMVIATNTPLSGAVTFAERLRREVADAIMVPPGERTGGRMVRMTVSIGVTEVGPETGTVIALLKNADDALARAKARGRNIVFVNKSETLAA
jgi:diguanylate cyclase (GGDEF)-like protein